MAQFFPFLPSALHALAGKAGEGAGEMTVCREGTDRVSLQAGRPQEAAGCPGGHGQEQTRHRLGEGREQRGGE